MRITIATIALTAVAAILFAQQPAPAPLRFVLLGDRTGETQPGIYEAVWREIAATQPAFVVGVGDSIQGLDDVTAEKEWLDLAQTFEPFHKIPWYTTPGNHDVWSAASARLYEKYAGHPLDYSFDSGPVHVTILDNSRSDDLKPEEMAFLEKDLLAHASQPVKFIVSHRPAWLLNAILRNTGFPLHQMAKKYGVHNIIAGHVHEIMHVPLDGIEYVSTPSAGGHLRASGKYEDGWFFGYTLVTVNGTEVAYQIHELLPPNGQGRVTPLSAWGPAGLIH